MLLRPALKPCPFHGCTDIAVMSQDNYVFAYGITCGVKGAAYNQIICGKDFAQEMAIEDWNKRDAHKH